MGLGKRLMHAWNVFNGRQDAYGGHFDDGPTTYGHRPDRVRLSFANERSLVASIITRIGIDAAAVDMYHARVDENDAFSEIIDSGLNRCLTVEANLDQSGRAGRQDMVMTLCEEGVIAVVPVETSASPLASGGYDIRNYRVGKPIAWTPDKVRVRLYNEETGRKEDILLPKRLVAIVENPLYSVMNEPNSTLQRLISKLNILDAIDSQSGSGKLDLLIQLPYVVKSETRKQQAQERKAMLEEQLQNSKYGIGYIDATEKVTQLNRPAENNLFTQVEYLTEQLYGQLGITKEVMDGTADEKVMTNYYNRTIEPILGAIASEMTRKFITKTGYTQRQRVVYIRDPFKLMTAAELIEASDKLTRNAVVSSNEMRGYIGKRPVSDPKADELSNKNIPQPEAPSPQPTEGADQQTDDGPDGTRVQSIMEGK